MDGAFQVGDKGLNLGRKNVTYRTMVRGIVFVIHLVISLFGITCRMRDLQIMPRQLFLIRSASGKNTATRHNPGRGIMLSGVSAMVRPKGLIQQFDFARTVADTLPLN